MPELLSFFRGRTAERAGGALRAKGTVEALPAPRESELRRRMLERIKNTPLSAMRPLAALVHEFFPKASAKGIHAALQNALARAEKSVGWSVNKDTVRIGFYRNFAEYYTPLFHECGHSILVQLGRPNEEYLKEQLKEEDFCWRFARACSGMFGFPYDPVSERLARKFYAVRDKIADGKNLELFDRFVEEERKETGFSELGGDTFSWVDDRPVIVKMKAEKVSQYAQAA